MVNCRQDLESAEKTMKNLIDISVIIVEFNTAKILSDCLNSLSGQMKRLEEKKSAKVEVIVVDNASSDDSVKMVRNEFPWVRLVVNEENIGFSRANNQAARLSKGEFLLFLNSDTLLCEKSLENLWSFWQNHENAGVVGPKLLNPDGTSQPSVGSFPSLGVVSLMLFWEHFFGSRMVRASFLEEKEVDWVMGAALMTKKEVWEKVGGWDEAIFMYMDEVEFCYRIKKAGWPIFFYPEAEVIHLGRASSRRGKKDPIINIYRGLVYFYQKHRGKLARWVLHFLLKTKAILALILGNVTQNNYLKETYEEALQVA